MDPWTHLMMYSRLPVVLTCSLNAWHARDCSSVYLVPPCLDQTIIWWLYTRVWTEASGCHHPPLIPQMIRPGDRCLFPLELSGVYNLIQYLFTLTRKNQFWEFWHLIIILNRIQSKIYNSLLKLLNCLWFDWKTKLLVLTGLLSDYFAA